MIVESPAKCKKIEDYLGSDWTVKASFGHIRDLPEKEMGVSLTDFRPTYQINSRSKKNIADLKKLVKISDQVYLATDPDREGESISWHLKEVLGLKTYKRVSFNEVTKKALLKSLDNASDIDFNLVKAQEGRRIIDRLVGYSVSPAISDIYGSWITAGRVQSVAVRIVVDKEIAIRDFKSTDYYEVILNFITGDICWSAKWNPKDYLLSDNEYIQDQSLVDDIANTQQVRIVSCDTKDQFRKAPAPFITSTLQQAASSSLKISPKKCMELAQKLFDDGFITYHRTDNPNVSEDGFNAIVDWLDFNGYENDRVQEINKFKAKSGAQEGHEALRPTLIALTPEDISSKVDDDMSRLYQLIWFRSVACQMKPAKYSVTNIKCSSLSQVNEKHPEFNAQGRELLNQGWLKLGKTSEDSSQTSDNEYENSQTVPKLQYDDKVVVSEGKALAKKTKPPRRYTEASLVKKLEDEGIGRPSTYASILENISKRGYVKIIKRFLHAQELGFVIHKLLINRFSFMELSYTREIEQSLDALAHGKKQYRDVMQTVYDHLSEELKLIADVKIEGVEKHDCPKCQSNLRLIQNKFWGCSNYPTCDYSATNVGGKPVERDPVNKVLDESNPCECGNGFYQLRKAAKDTFFGCSNYPTCKNTKQNKNGVPIEAEKISTDSLAPCPLCADGKAIKKIVLKSGKNKGKEFYCCTINECDYFAWVEKK